MDMPRTRTRTRFLARSTLTLGLLLLALWFTSGFFGIAIGFTSSRQLVLACGCIDYYRQDLTFTSGFPSGVEFIPFPGG